MMQPASEGIMQRFSMRFKSDASELCFIESRSDKLNVNLAYGLAALAATTIFTIFTPWDHGVQFAMREGDDMVQRHRAGKICISVLSLLGALFCRLNVRMRWLGPIRMEQFASVVVALCAAQVFFSNPYLVSKLHGYDPEIIFRSENGETVKEKCQAPTACLMIDAIITIVHMSIPLRCCMFLPLDVAGVLIAVSCIILGPEDEQSHGVFLLVCIVGLITFAILGSRMLEHAQRQSFLALLEEKCKRVATEFQLEALSQNTQSGEGDLRSEAHSAATIPTTASTCMFDLRMVREDGMTDLPHERLLHLHKLGAQQRWLIDPAHVELMPTIVGRGKFGIVVEAAYGGTPVAVKIPGGKLLAPALSELGNELRVLRHLRHPNIVSLHGACVVPERGQLALVLELVRGYQLDTIVLMPLMARDRHQILKGVCSALTYLHSRQPAIVHGDVKASNIIVQRSADAMCPKLLDFGLARVMSKHARPLGGTLRYMAPEVMRGAAPQCASDVFSFGRLVFVVLTGLVPLRSFSEDEVRRMSQACSPELDWPADIEPSLQVQIAHQCMQFDASSRPAMSEIQNTLSSGFEPAASEGGDWCSSWEEAYPKLREQALQKQRRKKNNKALCQAEQALSSGVSQLLLSEVLLEFNPLDIHHSVTKCTLNFVHRMHEQGRCGIDSVHLKHWLPANTLPKLLNSVSLGVNQAFYSRKAFTETVKMGSAALCLPAELRQCGTDLCARACQLDIQPPADDDYDDESSFKARASITFKLLQEGSENSAQAKASL
eukprot:TRINITY_DN41872_c0_g1_i1.p1 TRINITY_DN41872_c0_g1~~TRINITY_DN41872_c0_g1_i1.p1  ORF type:complete len:776 (+),score=119.72 TRINITY_DN41872_c0_g1_i1:109-2436(+)